MLGLLVIFMITSGSYAQIMFNEGVWYVGGGTYSSIDELPSGQYLVSDERGRYGVVDPVGAIVVPVVYYDITLRHDDSNHYFYEACLTEKETGDILNESCGMWNTAGKHLLADNFYEVYVYANLGHWFISARLANGHEVAASLWGNWQTPPMAGGAGLACGGVVFVNLFRDDQTGEKLLDTLGYQIISVPGSDHVYPLKSGLYVYSAADKGAVIKDFAGKVLTPEFIRLGDFDDGRANYSLPHEVGYLDEKTLNLHSVMNCDSCRLSEFIGNGYASLSMKGGGEGIINLSGKMVVPMEWSEITYRGDTFFGFRYRGEEIEVQFMTFNAVEGVLDTTEWTALEEKPHTEKALEKYYGTLEAYRNFDWSFELPEGYTSYTEGDYCVVKKDGNTVFVSRSVEQVLPLAGGIFLVKYKKYFPWDKSSSWDDKPLHQWRAGKYLVIDRFGREVKDSEALWYYNDPADGLTRITTEGVVEQVTIDGVSISSDPVGYTDAAGRILPWPLPGVHSLMDWSGNTVGLIACGADRLLYRPTEECYQSVITTKGWSMMFGKAEWGNGAGIRAIVVSSSAGTVEEFLFDIEEILSR
jgi:hypothetical protein